LMNKRNLASLGGLTAILFCVVVVVQTDTRRDWPLPDTPQAWAQTLLRGTFGGHSEAIENGTRLLQLLTADGSPDALQAYVGRQVVFLGGGAPPGATADLLIADDVRLEVTIKPPREVRPMAVMWEACVLGTVRRIDRKRKVISIDARPEDWVVVETW
jgi:hypothetical protein